MTNRRCWGTLTDTAAAMTAHRPPSSAMYSNDETNRSSLMLSFHDIRGLPLRRPPSTVPCSTIFGSVSRGQTWPNHDSLRRLPVDSKSPDIRQGYWPVATHIHLVCFLLSVWYGKHSSGAFVCKGLDSPLQIHCQRPAPTFMEQYWYDKWREWLGHLENVFS